MEGIDDLADPPREPMGDLADKPRGGRPRAREVDEPREFVGFTAPAHQARMIEAAAKANGRSKSLECSTRLARSFERQELLPDALQLTFGRGLAAAILLVGSAMNNAGRRCAAAAAGSLDAQDTWMRHPYAFDQATRAARFVLKGLRPAGVVEMPKVDSAWLGAPPEHVGETAGFFTLAAAKEPDQVNRDLPPERQNLGRETFFRDVNSLLGTLAAEIKTPLTLWCQPQIEAIERELGRVRDVAKREALLRRLDDFRIEVRDAAGDSSGHGHAE
jgi:hypothetical protein